MGRILGIDPGKRRVGIAVTDEARVMASPRQVIDREIDDFAQVLSHLVEELAVEKIVIGYPEPFSGQKNERTREVDEFIGEYIEPLGLPLHRISERFTTKKARRLQKIRGKDKENADADAAALILNHYLKRLENQPVNGDD